MYARIEVAVKPGLSDPAAQNLLRRLELSHPELRSKVRWARLLDVYWLDLSLSREELIPVVTEVFWDRVLQWMFTGNLIPSAAGSAGGLTDLMEHAPFRPGKFWALERRLRAGIADQRARAAQEAFEVVLGRPLTEARIASGSMLLLEGPELNDVNLATLARDVFCNDLLETWTIFPEVEFRKNDRFHQERVKRDVARTLIRPRPRNERDFSWSLLAGVSQVGDLQESELQERILSFVRSRGWSIGLEEIRALYAHCSAPRVANERKLKGLPETPTPLELEALARFASHRSPFYLERAKILYSEESGSVPSGGAPEGLITPEINQLFSMTFAATLDQMPKGWLLPCAGAETLVALNEDEAVCLASHSSSLSIRFDPEISGTQTLLNVHRNLLAQGLGAFPIGIANVLCLAPPTALSQVEASEGYPSGESGFTPRRKLEGIWKGVESATQGVGLPNLGGALVFSDTFVDQPLVFGLGLGLVPRKVLGRTSQKCEIKNGDRLCVVGGLTGRDAVSVERVLNGAEMAVAPAVIQFADAGMERRLRDLVLDAREYGLVSAWSSLGVQGLFGAACALFRKCRDSESLVTLGLRVDLDRLPKKEADLAPEDLLFSETPQRMLVVVPGEKLDLFLNLVERRGVFAASVGEVQSRSDLELRWKGQVLGSLDPEFLFSGLPQPVLQARWSGVPPSPKEASSSFVFKAQAPLEARSFQIDAPLLLRELLSRPNICSRETLIRRLDHEVGGLSLIKSMHTASPGTPQAASGPNDAVAVLSALSHRSALVLSTGVQVALGKVDPYWMAEASFDEAIRNALCVGADFGRLESILAAHVHFSLSNLDSNPALVGALVRASFGLREAALALGVPVLGKSLNLEWNALHAPLNSSPSSGSNFGSGSVSSSGIGFEDSENSLRSIPQLIVSALGQVSDVGRARTADFKAAGDVIYLLGPGRFGLWGSEFAEALSLAGMDPEIPFSVGTPQWDLARQLYAWLGGALGQESAQIRSLHDVSEGGLLVALSECILSRGLGARIHLPTDVNPWEFCFGEGFHSFVATVPESHSAAMEADLRLVGIPFVRLGQVTSQDRLEVHYSSAGGSATSRSWQVGISVLRAAYAKEGYWE